jgi:hypothetical protein
MMICAASDNQLQQMTKTQSVWEVIDERIFRRHQQKHEYESEAFTALQTLPNRSPISASARRGSEKLTQHLAEI